MTAIPVSATDGVTTTGIDTVLETGRRINGTIAVPYTPEAPDYGLKLAIYDSIGGLVDDLFFDDYYLDSGDDSYQTPVLIPGNYRLRFEAINADSSVKYIREYYNDKQTLATADIISLGASSSVNDIDVVFARDVSGDTTELQTSIDGPAIISVYNGQYSPNPFDISATISNIGSTTANNIQVSLNLPDELDYTSPNPTLTYNVASLAPGQQFQVSWNVEVQLFDIPDPSRYTSYSVNVVADNAASQSTEKQIIIPAVFLDDFNDNKINASYWIDDIDIPITYLEEVNGQVELTLPDLILSQDQKFPKQWSRGYTSSCQLRGDFDIQTDYALSQWPSSNGVRIGIVANEAGSVMRASYGPSTDFPGQPREVYATEHAKLGGSTKDVVNIPTNDLLGKLRLVRSGNISTGYYYSAGAWTQIAQGSATIRDTNFGFDIWTQGDTFANHEVKAFFDNFVVNKGQLLCDTDSDGLLDDWESNGIDINKDGLKDLILSTDPRHKDLFVEADYMECGVQGSICDSLFAHSHKPNDDFSKDITEAFAKVPVANPDGIPGIRLHVEIDEAVPEIKNIVFNSRATESYDDFDDIKDGTVQPCDGHFGKLGDRESNSNCANILAAKLLVYRYAIFGHAILGTGATGQSEMPGNDFLISLGGWYNIQHLGGYRDVEAATFMHELGHTLGLSHGGSLFNYANCKPNYYSVMNYTYQFTNFDPTRPLAYSNQALATLNEKSLDETKGVGGATDRYVVYNNTHLFMPRANEPVDWNNDGDTQDTNVSADINYHSKINECNQPSSDQVLEGYNDLNNLRYRILSSGDYQDGIHYTASEIREPSEEEVIEAAKSVDFDRDGFNNYDDNCPAVSNPDQQDTDHNGVGDVCDILQQNTIYVPITIR